MIRAVLSLISFVVATLVGSVIAVLTPLFDRTGDAVLPSRASGRARPRRSRGEADRELASTLDPKTPLRVHGQPRLDVDILSLFVGVPFPVRMIAKKQLGRIPFFGWAMHAGRFIFIDRQNPMAARRSIEEAARRIQRGSRCCSSPRGRAPATAAGAVQEGRLSPGDRVGRRHRAGGDPRQPRGVPPGAAAHPRGSDPPRDRRADLDRGPGPGRPRSAARAGARADRRDARRAAGRRPRLARPQ